MCGDEAAAARQCLEISYPVRQLMRDGNGNLEISIHFKKGKFLILWLCVTGGQWDCQELG